MFVLSVVGHDALDVAVVVESEEVQVVSRLASLVESSEHVHSLLSDRLSVVSEFPNRGDPHLTRQLFA